VPATRCPNFERPSPPRAVLPFLSEDAGRRATTNSRADATSFHQTLHRRPPPRALLRSSHHLLEDHTITLLLPGPGASCPRPRTASPTSSPHRPNVVAVERPSPVSPFPPQCLQSSPYLAVSLLAPPPATSLSATTGNRPAPPPRGEDSSPSLFHLKAASLALFGPGHFQPSVNSGPCECPKDLFELVSIVQTFLKFIEYSFESRKLSNQL
jgi:hypothetical protein